MIFLNMNKSTSFFLSISILGIISIWTVSVVVAQPFSGSNNIPKPLSANETSIKVNANVVAQVSNETMKDKEGFLKSAVTSFLNSGPNVLKTLPTEQPTVKTSILNFINNDTQNVEGVEATNAIIGVELGKAIKTIVSTSTKSNQTGTVTVVTSSSCAPSSENVLSCANVVNIR
jgi:hypothetical protein